jgi:hypothetical protein
MLQYINIIVQLTIFHVDYNELVTFRSLTRSRCRYAPFKRVRVMVFNVSFNNISIISWRSVLLVELVITSVVKQPLPI